MTRCLNIKISSPVNSLAFLMSSFAMLYLMLIPSRVSFNFTWWMQNLSPLFKIGLIRVSKSTGSCYGYIWSCYSLSELAFKLVWIFCSMSAISKSDSSVDSESLANPFLLLRWTYLRKFIKSISLYVFLSYPSKGIKSLSGCME